MSRYDTHPKHVLNLVSDYLARIVLCPAAVLDYPHKREKAITQAGDRFGLAFEAHSLLNPLNASYMLGQNDVIVNPFVKECAQLLGCIEFFERITKQQSKGCQEVQEFYKEAFALLDKKELFNAMCQDLDFWADTYEFEYDMQSQVADPFKLHKKEMIQTLEKRHEKRR